MDYLCILLNNLEIRDRKTKKQELRYREIENIELKIEIQLETTIDLSEDTLEKKRLNQLKDCIQTNKFLIERTIVRLNKNIRSAYNI